MNSTDKALIAAHVIARRLDEETVILDIASGTYFGLDPVGTRIWTLLSEGKALGETCDAMLDEFEVERERLEQDMADLLEQLVGRGLIEIEA